ncbi:MAG: ABC transporter ATP-binding protein [Dehalococcoidales bacterium]|nr:ABC transporter ATP-binding protein [Dehalococcoidales bacterium]
MDNVLEVRHLTTHFFTRLGVVRAVDDVSFTLRKKECLCLVGESGCGKTTAALSILRLVDSPPGRILGGEIIYQGEDLIKVDEARLRQVRGDRIAMIFQNPQSSLNPVFTVGDQIAETLKLHRGLSRNAALEKSQQLMTQVGIPQAAERGRDYPHQLSGGMKQRVMIAMALTCQPEVIIADEPTAALDTTIKAQILDILIDLKQSREMSLLFITHDFGTVASIADSIAVMYGGKIVESGATDDIFDHPTHPYTVGLLNCLPKITKERSQLMPIPGTIPSLTEPVAGCIFYPRCACRLPVCNRNSPPDVIVAGEHVVSCHLCNDNKR